MPDEDEEEEIPFEEEAVQIPITNELDLHTFRPNEVSIVIPEYFRECRMRGILEVRVIHGKGSGTLRQGVIELLKRLPEVVGCRTGGMTEGSWGATMVQLAPWDEEGD